MWILMSLIWRYRVYRTVTNDYPTCVSLSDGDLRSSSSSTPYCGNISSVGIIVSLLSSLMLLIFLIRCTDAAAPTRSPCCDVTSGRWRARLRGRKCVSFYARARDGICYLWVHYSLVAVLSASAWSVYAYLWHWIVFLDRYNFLNINIRPIYSCLLLAALKTSKLCLITLATYINV